MAKYTTQQWNRKTLRLANGANTIDYLTKVPCPTFMIFWIGCQMKEKVIKSVNIFIPPPLIYIMNRVMNMFENPDVAADQAFYYTSLIAYRADVGLPFQTLSVLEPAKVTLRIGQLTFLVLRQINVPHFINIICGSSLQNWIKGLVTKFMIINGSILMPIQTLFDSTFASLIAVDSLDSYFFNQMFYQRFGASVDSYKAMNLILEEDSSLNQGALWLGDYTAANDIQTLKSKGIKTVLCVAAGLNIKYPAGSGINQKVYNILDIESANIARLFNDTYNVISDGLSQGGVLVHCAAGVSRSSSTVIAYLMRKQKMSFNDAFMFVKKRRSVICPNYGFQRQLKAFERDLKQTQLSQSSQNMFKVQQVVPNEQETHKPKSKAFTVEKTKDQMSVTSNQFVIDQKPSVINHQALTTSTVVAKHPFSNMKDSYAKQASPAKIQSGLKQSQFYNNQPSTIANSRIMQMQHATTYNTSYGTKGYKPQIVTYNQRNQLQDSRQPKFNTQNLVSYHQNPYAFKN